MEPVCTTTELKTETGLLATSHWNIPVDINFKIANFLPQYKLLRAVSSGWQKLLDSDEYFASRTLARGRVTAHELPIDQVTKRLLPREIKFDLWNAKFNLSDDAIRRFPKYINWTILCRCQTLSLDIVNEFEGNIHWSSMVRSGKIHPEIIRKFACNFEKEKLFKYHHNIPIEVLEKYVEHYPKTVALYKQIGEDFIEKHINELKSNAVCTHQRLSEDFIRKHANWVEWDCIFVYQILSESFIEEFIARGNWKVICEYQMLSFPFILRHGNSVNWSRIYRYHRLAPEEIEQLLSVFPIEPKHWKIISEIQSLSEDFIREHRDKVNWHNISSYQKLSVSFLREFKDLVVWKNIPQNNKIVLSREEKIEFLDLLFP